MRSTTPEFEKRPRKLSNEFYSALGRMAAAWAGLEITAHMNIEVINLCYGGKKIEKEFPEQISRKLKYLLRAYRTIPELSRHSHVAIPLVEQARSLSEERHFAIHGAAMTALDSATAEFYRRRNSADDLIEQVRAISKTRLLEMAVEMRETGLKLGIITWKLMEEVIFPGTDGE